MIALSTTALALVLPVLRDRGRLDQPFGRLLLATGTIGELGPIVAVALVLSDRYSRWQEFGFLVGFLSPVALVAAVGTGVRPPKVLALLSRTLHASTQLPVRFASLILANAYVLADALGLKGIHGAFAAGMVVGLARRDPDAETFRHKVEAVCFGWLSPFFFVGTGIIFKLSNLWQDAATIVLLPLFLLLFLGIPGHSGAALSQDLPPRERLPFAFYSPVPSLGLMIVITQIGLHARSMNPDIAQALIGAGLVSALLLPTLAALLSRPSSAGPANVAGS